MADIILLDGFMQLYRANFKLSDLVTRNGQPTGMEYGFLKSLEALCREFKDDIIICWEGRNNFRYKIDSEYKANRREKRAKDAHKFLTPERINGFKKLLSMVAKTAVDDELEADDIIASLAERYCKTEPVTIYSGDKDLHQLVRGKPFRVIQVRGFQWRKQPWTVSRIKEKYHGLRPDQLAVYFAFVGDTIDNIPGAKRVRSTLIGAAIYNGYKPKNLSNYELFSGKEVFALEEHYDSGRFQQNLELVTLRVKKDIVVRERNWQPDKVKEWLENMEIQTLKLCKECGGTESIIREDEDF